jgi:hypothetical protein
VLIPEIARVVQPAYRRSAHFAYGVDQSLSSHPRLALLIESLRPS